MNKTKTACTLSQIFERCRPEPAIAMELNIQHGFAKITDTLRVIKDGPISDRVGNLSKFVVNWVELCNCAGITANDIHLSFAECLAGFSSRRDINAIEMCRRNWRISTVKRANIQSLGWYVQELNGTFPTSSAADDDIDYFQMLVDINLTLISGYSCELTDNGQLTADTVNNIVGIFRWILSMIQYGNITADEIETAVSISCAN